MDQQTLNSLNEVNDQIDRFKANAKATLSQTGAKAMEALLPVLEKGLNILNAILTVIGNMSTEQISMIINILAIVAAISPIFSMISKIASGVSGLIALGGTIAGFVATHPVLSAIIAIIAIIAVLATVIATHWEEIKATIESIKESVINAFNTMKESIINAFEIAKSAVVSVVEGIKNVVHAVINGIIQLVENGINHVINKINDVINMFNAVVSMVASIAGFSFGGISTLSNVSLPKLAKGGNVLSGSAIVGEAGPELLTVAGGKTTVTPLTASLDSNSLKALSGIGGNMRQNININFTGSLSQLAQVLEPYITTESNRRGVKA